MGLLSEGGLGWWGLLSEGWLGWWGLLSEGGLGWRGLLSEGGLGWWGLSSLVSMLACCEGLTFEQEKERIGSRRIACYRYHR